MTGLPGNTVPPKADYAMREIADLKRQMRELQQALGLQTGMSFVNNQIRVAADTAVLSEDFDGTLDPPAAGNNGWALTGDTVIANAAKFKNLLIDNDALASPVGGDVVNGVAAGLTFTGTATVYETQTFTVPAGFTRALVSGIATAGASCTASNGTGLTTRCGIGGVGGDSIGCIIAVSGANSISAPFARDITGLNGGDLIAVTCTVVISAGLPIAAGTGNARVSASALFLR